MWAEEKCFLCDSRYPYNPYTQHNSHMVENVITTFEPKRKKKWWQSENGIDHVSIRLDLETLFQFSHLILTFKTFRPAAMLVERSTDFGQTWKVFRYFAHDCAASFPNISSGPAKSVGDVICDSRYSDIEPSTEGEVVLKALDPSFEIENPYVPYIQDLITLTNLRINFTKLHTLGDALLGRRHSDPLEKYYYAIYEMVVQGSCFCNGHASQCDSMQNLRGDVFHQSGMVHGRCICHHNTEGFSCERCKDFYNDAPWRPAEGTQDNACKRCNCNSHSSRCHFDMAVYQASGGVSGGVCEDCQDNTTGQHCDSCDPEGSLHEAVCESRTDPTLGTVAGRCPCKENVEGARCDKCKANYYGLSSSDPLGCQPCNCDPLGSLPFSVCNPATGECLCQRFTTGQRCEKCLAGYWGLGNNLYGCSPCDCDIGGSQNNLCSLKDGQCECLPNIVSRQCNEPAPGYFFLPLDYYIYEAEHAKPLSGSAPLVQPSTLPRCDIYFQKKGYEFMIENGKIVLQKNKKRAARKSGLEQGAMQFGQDSDLAVVFRQPSAGRAVTWTGHGFARVPSGAGLRFAISNVPFAMDFDITVRYEPEFLEDWLASVAIQPAGILSGQHCKNKVLSHEPHELPLPATKRIGSVENLCSEKDLDEYQKYHCIEIASEVGPHVLPEACARLIVSLSARIHNGAVACKCNPQGSLNASCSKLGGQCHCKANIVGRCCDTCSAGSYGFGFHGCYGAWMAIMETLWMENPATHACAQGHLQAIVCTCNLAGVHPAMCPGGDAACLCDPATGACPCLPNVLGATCDQCASGYWDLASGKGCQTCDCDPKNSQSNQCNQLTGQCPCKPGYSGRFCNECEENYFGNPQMHCVSCECNLEGTRQPTCDKATGACNCRAGVTGRLCDQCSRGFQKDFPSCTQCHLCFDQWDTEIAALAQSVQGLMRFAAKLEDKGGRMPSCDMRFKAFEDAISETERVLRHPVLSLEAFSVIRDFQGYLQQKVAQMAPHLPFEFPDLNKSIEDIVEEANLVFELLQQKIHLHQSFQYLNFKEAISNIRKHSEVSLLAEQMTRRTTPIVRHSEYTRSDTLTMFDHQVLNTSMVLQQLRMIKSPDIQNLNEKICGVPGNQPCVTAACGGALCQDSHGLRKCGGPDCTGALPFSSEAFRKAEETAVLLNNLTTQLQEPGNQVKSIRKMAEDSKLKGSRFNGQLVTAMNQIEADGETTKEFIQKVKNFLLDESAPPEDIEKVANYVLQINLPLTPQELTGMFGKLQSILNHCEKYKLDNKRNTKREDAQTLLVEAQEADKAAKALLPVDEINNKLKNIVKSQGHSKNTIIKLNEEIQGIRTQTSQAEKQVNKTNDKLNDLLVKQTEMEDESATWQAKTLMNKIQATKARAEAEAAHKQAQKTDNEFTDVKRKYTILQEKLKTQGPPKVTLEKVKQLKEEAEKLAEETEKKIKRITDLEKKLQELNQTKQDKAEQLRQLEEQVIAIKNEIMEQESKYATCK
ncbi:Laminin subunit beta-4, partial [Lonchura striata]